MGKAQRKSNSVLWTLANESSIVVSCSCAAMLRVRQKVLFKYTFKRKSFLTSSLLLSGALGRKTRRQIKKIGDNTDIIGSTADSLKKGIKIPEGQEKRITNPLDPIYKIPGNSELTSDNINDPFGEAGCSVSKTNFNQKR